MTRVLHLFRQDADPETCEAAAVLAAGAGPELEFETASIGRGGTFRSAVHAILPLRREAGESDWLHAWDERSLLPAIIAGGGYRILFSPTVLPSRQTLGWMKAADPFREIHVVASTEWERATWLRHGVPAARCHWIRPGVVLPPQADDARRAALRARLGLATDDRVVLAPGASTRSADHERVAWAGSIFRIVDSRFRVLIAGHGDRVSTVRRTARAMRYPEMLVVAADRAPDLTAADLAVAADVAVVCPNGAADVRSIATAMAAGTPIIATAAGGVTGFLRDGRNALVLPSNAPPAIARRVLELFDDPAMANRLGRAARSEAVMLFDPSRYAAQFRILCRSTPNVAADEAFTLSTT